MSQSKKTYADLTVQYINQLGVDYVFGVPGGAIEPFLDALARSERQGGVKFVCTRHEAGAAFMAEGYARETGKIGVCCATTGPGATNLLTGVASAYADAVPILVITAQTPLPKFGRRALQDSSCAAIDIVGMFRFCTRYNSLISHRHQLETKLAAAIMTLNRLPLGPIHISVPSDILRRQVDKLANVHASSLLKQFRMHDHFAFEQLVAELQQADKVALYIGNGCAGASAEIMALAELLNAHFVSGPMAKRWVDEKHPLYRGVYGFAGHASAGRLIEEVDEDLDLVLAIGAALGELSTSGWNEDLLNDRLIHIDSATEHFSRSPMAKLHVCGDLPTIFKTLLPEIIALRDQGKTWTGVKATQNVNVLGSCTSLEEEGKCNAATAPIKPQRLMRFLSETLPTDCRLFVDAGNAWAWSIHYYQRSEISGKYHVAMELGSMGWSVGAVIGSALGSPKLTPHVCLVGDGAYLMSAQEITVAKQLALPIVFILLNDGVLGMVKHGQKLGKAEAIGYRLLDINYAAMAQSMGVSGIEITEVDELLALDWPALFSANGPTLIDVRIDPEAVPPMQDRVKGLNIDDASAMPGG